VKLNEFSASMGDCLPRKVIRYGPGLVNFFPRLLKEVKMNFFGRSCLGHTNGSGGWCSLEDGFQISCSFG
jgi:hypothetical protein